VKTCTIASRSILAQRVVFRTLALAIVLLAFGVRLYHLGTMGLEFDEAFSVQAAFSDFSSMLGMLATHEPHPPFFYSFLRLWYPLVGTTEFALRFASVFANVLTVAFLLGIAEWFEWRAEGLIAAAFFAFNPYQIWYAQEVRMYAPVAVFGAGAAFFALRSLTTERRSLLVGYLVSMTLCLYTHYYGIFFFGFVNLATLAAIRYRPGTVVTLKRWLGLQTIVVALFIPWLAYAYRVGDGYIRDVPNIRGDLAIIRDSLLQYSLGWSAPSNGLTLSLIFLAVLLVGLVAAWTTRSVEPRWFRLTYVGGYLLLPLTVGFVVSAFRSMFAIRYFMVSSPAFFLVLGIGIVSLGRLAWPVGLAAFVGVLAMQAVSVHSYFVDPRFNKAELADAIQFIEAHPQPNQGFVLDGLGQTTQFWFYHDVRAQDQSPSYVFPLLGDVSADQLSATLADVMNRHAGVWLLDYGVLDWDPNRLVEQILARNYFPTFEHRLFGNRVIYYSSPPQTVPIVSSLDATCQNTLRAVDVTTYGTSASPGGTFPVAVSWQAITTETKAYVMSWRLIDASGHTVFQHDSEPANGFSATTGWTMGQTVVDHFGLLVPPELPPGQLSLVLIAYDKKTGDACQFQTSNGAATSPSLQLASIDVSDHPVQPTFSETVPTHPANVTVGGLTFEGYDQAKGPFRPGDVATVRLFWHVNRPITEDLDVMAGFVADQGASLGDSTTKLGPANYHTSKWAPGRTIATEVDIRIPARAMTGVDRLSLAVRGQSLNTSLVASPPLVSIVARERTFDVPTMSQPYQANFGNQIELLGYDLSKDPNGVVQPSQPIQLTLYWRDEGPIDSSYKVFTHLVGADGNIYGQLDSIPEAGNAPTTSWLLGEVLADHYTLSLDSTAPPGPYDVVIGIYDPNTGSRVPLVDHSGDSLNLARLQWSG
jgi:mannosyltransferase